MGFLDFFKKLAEKKPEKQETEKVSFNEINNWIKSKDKEIKNKEKETLALINEKVLESIKEINEKLIILENVDLESKKSEERLKLIVKETLNNYIKNVKNLTEKLSDLKEENPQNLIIKINNMILHFSTKSNKNYQRATILIGDEMADTKRAIANLFKYLEKTSNENKDTLNSSNIISNIKLKLNHIEETNTEEAEEKIKLLEKKIENIKETNKKDIEEIEKIKKSKNYLENLNKQKELKSDEEELKKEVYKLKEMIDFKSLGNTFHVDKKKMDVIKNHKESFQTYIYRDNGTNILSLLDESKLNNPSILLKIKQINDKRGEISKNQESIKKDESEELLHKTKNSNLEIENLNNEKTKELKIYEKLKIKEEEIISSIKQELAKINVELIENKIEAKTL